MKTRIGYDTSVFKKAQGILKMKKKMLNRVENELKDEMYKNVLVVSGCIGIALYENQGWRKNRIANLFSEISESWGECAKDDKMSMLEMCENETGIAVYREGYEGDYTELKYFQPRGKTEMTIDQIICMRQQQKKWAYSLIFASAFLAMHRLHGFGKKRILELRDQMEEVKSRYNGDAKKISSACFQITGVEMELT